MNGLSEYLQAVHVVQDPKAVKQSVKKLWRCVNRTVKVPSNADLAQMDLLLPKLFERKDLSPDVRLYCQNIISKKVLWQASRDFGEIFFAGDPTPLQLSPVYMDILKRESPVFKAPKIVLSDCSKETFEVLLQDLCGFNHANWDDQAFPHRLEMAKRLGLRSLEKNYLFLQASELSYELLYKMLLEPDSSAPALEKLLQRESEHLLRLGCVSQDTFESFCQNNALNIAEISAKVGTLSAAVLFPHHNNLSVQQTAAMVVDQVIIGNGHVSTWRLLAALKPAIPADKLTEVQDFLKNHVKLRSFLHLYLLDDPSALSHSERFTQPALWRQMLDGKWDCDLKDAYHMLDLYCDSITPSFKSFCQTQIISCHYAQGHPLDSFYKLDRCDQPSERYFMCLIMLGDYPRFYEEIKGINLSIQVHWLYWLHTLLPLYWLHTLLPIAEDLSLNNFCKEVLQYKRSGNLDAVREDWREHPLILAYQGLRHFEQNRIHDALESFNASLAKQANPGVAFRRAQCYARLGNHEQAQADLAKYPFKGEL